jgi:hypothetical protein
MTSRKPLYPPQEYARRGMEIYARVVEPALRPEDNDQFVAIDIESDDFEIDADDYLASKRLLERRPQAQIWIARVGRRAAYQMGARDILGLST